MKKMVFGFLALITLIGCGEEIIPLTNDEPQISQDGFDRLLKTAQNVYGNEWEIQHIYNALNNKYVDTKSKNFVYSLKATPKLIDRYGETLFLFLINKKDNSQVAMVRIGCSFWGENFEKKDCDERGKFDLINSK